MAWIFGLLADPATIHAGINDLLNVLHVLPAEAWQLVEVELIALTSRNTSISLAGVFNLLVALYLARRATEAMMQTLNKVYGVRETRGFLLRNAVAIIFTLAAIAVSLIVLCALVVLPTVFKFLGLGSLLAQVTLYLRWPALAVLMALALAVTYRFAPDRKNARLTFLSWGSGMATIVWLIASFGFSWYVSAFNSYNRVYGSLGAVMVLLFWFWISSFAALLGGELDNAIERRRMLPPR
jgi:membrane protein